MPEITTEQAIQVENLITKLGELIDPATLPEDIKAEMMACSQIMGGIIESGQPTPAYGAAGSENSGPK